MLNKNMKWNLNKVLFWWSILASCFLLLTVSNYLFNFANPVQPQHRLNIGLALEIKEFIFSLSAYMLIRFGYIKTCITIVMLWVSVKLIYGAAVYF